MTMTLRFQSKIVVADARPHDYQELALLAVKYGWHVHQLTSATAALRLTRSMAVDLYLVNTNLPDMSGFDLFEMLHDRVPAARVFIVSDSYNDADERQAYRCGAALYVCKGPNRRLDFASLLDFQVGQCKPSLDAQGVASPTLGVDSLQQSCRARSTPDVPLSEPMH